MNDLSTFTGLALMLGVCVIGFLTSWIPQLRRLHLWRWLLLGLATVFLMLPLSALLRSDTLGWLFGLSLIFLLPVMLLFGIGVVLGHWFAAKNTGKDEEKEKEKEKEKDKDEAEVAPFVARTALKIGLDVLRQRADVLLVVAGVGAGFAVLIGTGFHLSGDPIPAAVSTAYVPGIVVLLVVFGIVIRRIAQNWHYRRSDPTSTRDSRHWKVERDRFLAELAADPVRRPYLARIERGEHWSADRIAYDLDRDAAATCVHLRPIERAIRKAGIRVRLQWTNIVDVECMIDAQALARQFDLASTVAYTEPQYYDRSAEDPPSALISCSTCRSCINTVHRSVAANNTPSWPE